MQWFDLKDKEVDPEELQEILTAALKSGMKQWIEWQRSVVETVFSRTERQQVSFGDMQVRW